MSAKRRRANVLQDPQVRCSSSLWTSRSVWPEKVRTIARQEGRVRAIQIRTPIGAEAERPMPSVPAQREPYPWLTLILAVALGAILLFAAIVLSGGSVWEDLGHRIVELGT